MEAPAPNADPEPPAPAPPPAFPFTRPLHRCDTVGKLIVYYRELKGWSQKQLRTALHMRQSRLSSLERGVRQPSFAEIQRIALLLGQPVDRFCALRNGLA